MAKKLSSVLEIKGYGNNVNIILGNEADFSEVEAELTRKLEDSNQFLSGVKVVLDAGDRVLSTEECEKLRQILNGRFNLVVSTVRTRSDETRKTAEEIGWSVELQKQENQQQEKKKEKRKEETKTLAEKENDTILIKQTLRSGQGEWHRGNIVIIGDVNPGAEVVATGDVVIMGKLRGIAHAGAEGDTSAVIVALDLCPIQLRIAGYIGRSPDRDLKKDNVPEVAQVEDGNIVIRKLK